MKLSVMTLVMASLLLVSCNEKNTDQKQQSEEVARSMFDAFNRHDWKAMADHYIDSASFLDPSLGTEYVKQSHADIEGKYSEMQKMFADIHDEIIGVYPSGDKVTVEFVSTGSAQDENGERISFKLPIVTVLTISNGKIVKDATYYDNE